MTKINKTQSGRGYLFRASASDACNYNCSFCHPREHEPVNILTNEEFLSIFKIANEMYELKTLHFTGGEPLMRKGLPELIAGCRKIAGNDLEIAITTNGSLLSKNLNALLRAGLSRANISIHSLDPKKYQEFTGTKIDVNQVKEDVREAMSAGLKIKINMSVIKGFNDAEILNLANYAFKEGIIPRFLELGTEGPVSQWFSPNDAVPHDEIYNRMQRIFGIFERDLDYRGNGPTKYYKNVDGKIFGILDNQSDKRCRGCDRFRMSANGFIKVCNFPPIDLRPFIGSEDKIREQFLMLGNVLHSRGQDYINKRLHRNDYNFRWNHPEKNINQNN